MNTQQESAKRQSLSVYIRNFTFGVEDSLVSTVGLISGVAAGGVPGHTILLTGTVLIFVEAFSMGVGSLLSEHSAEEYTTQTKVAFDKSIKAPVLMFFSYFISGFIPLSPYVWLPVNIAFPLSIALSLFALFILGLVSGSNFGTGALRSGLRMFLIGGFAIVLGVLVGGLIGAS